jgi:hypothetical protein
MMSWQGGLDYCMRKDGGERSEREKRMHVWSLKAVRAS